VHYAEWWLKSIEENPGLPDSVLWSDEALFRLNGTVNRHNCCFWSPTNPQMTLEKSVNASGEWE